MEVEVHGAYVNNETGELVEYTRSVSVGDDQELMNLTGELFMEPLEGQMRFGDKVVSTV